MGLARSTYYDEPDGQPIAEARRVERTDSDHYGPIFPNLAKDVVPTGPNELWVADITYIAIARGFVYLAAILDASSRRVVGYAIGRRIDARLALAALRAAIASRHPPMGCTLTIPIAARSTPQRTTAPNSKNMVSEVRWVGAATPTTTPRPRAS